MHETTQKTKITLLSFSLGLIPVIKSLLGEDDNAKKLVESVKAKDEFVKKLIIGDQKTLGEAFEELKNIKKMKDEIEGYKSRAKKPIDACGKEILDYFRDPLLCIDNYEKTLKLKASNFMEAEEKKRREIEAKLREEARLEAEKKEKEAEVLRQKQAKLELEGKEKEAEKIQEKIEKKEKEIDIVNSLPPVITASYDKPTNISSVREYKYEILDEKLIPKEYLMIDEKKIASYAKAMKGTGTIPGIRFFDVPNIKVRTK
jgi:hypothetical protein